MHSAPAIIHDPVLAKAADPAELAAIFSRVGRADPPRSRTGQVLPARVTAATNASADHRLTGRSSGHTSGRLHEPLE